MPRSKTHGGRLGTPIAGGQEALECLMFGIHSASAAIVSGSKRHVTSIEERSPRLPPNELSLLSSSCPKLMGHPTLPLEGFDDAGP